MMYKTRTVEGLLSEMGKSFPCIAVYGARQVGKSTTVDHLFGSSFRSVTLDDLEERTLATTNPRLFLDAHRWPLVIDEIQKAPTLLDEIKIRIDAQRLRWLKNEEPRSLMYVITGSNRYELQKGVSDSLAGRCGIVEMHSFTEAEKYDRKTFPFTADAEALLERQPARSDFFRTREEIFQDIFAGGMPDVATGVSDRAPYFSSYLATYIERDVRSLILASSESQFREFLSIAALRTAQELHLEEIAAAVGIDTRTCRKWLSILESSGIIFLLQPFMANLSKRIIKTPKLYFLDTGLCSFLCGWQDPAMLEKSSMGGPFFETFVVSEIVKNLSAFGKNPKECLFYYRDIDRKEIDLLFTVGSKLYPIEIKKGISPNKPARNFSVLEKYKMAVQPGLVIDNCGKMMPLGDNAWSFPVSRLGM